MMQDVRRKQPIKYNKDGSVSLDGSGVKILRLLEPQGEPDVIECDGARYVPERTCHVKVRPGDNHTDVCESCDQCNFGWHRSIYDKPFLHCPNCRAKVVE